MFASLHVCGVYLCDEETRDFVPFSSPEQFIKLKRGEKIPEIIDILKKYGTVTFEQEDVARIFDQPYKFPNPAGEYLRDHIVEIVDTHVKERMREISFVLVKEKIRKSSEKKDKFIVEGVRALDEVDQVLNVLCERLREWYSLHHPELDKKMKDNSTYAKSVFQGAHQRDSMGAALEPEDERKIREFAGRISGLFEERKELENYVTVETQKIAPNLCSLLGSVLSARLISAVGGLEELARLPSSTIQVLGAEKALFRHLRTGARPPKHGLIFQHPLVNRAPKKMRGKISRSLAAKIAILSRVDCYSGEFVAEEVEQKLQERISKLQVGK